MKKKIFIIILCFILALILLLFLIKFYKINKIINLMKSNSENLDNYSYIIDSTNIKRNGNIIVYNNELNNNNYYYYFYYNFNDNKLYTFDNIIKKYYISKIDKYQKSLLNLPLYEDLTLDYSLLDKLKYVFQWKISNYDNENYEITTKNNNKVIIDKKTGFILKSSNIGLNKETVVENFKINCVTEDEVKLPDLNEYKLEETND